MLTPFIAFFTIIVVALLVVQLGANALTLTGMSQSVARFQACSAFFGVGFTTREAEMVVDHPVRRRIILHLIIAGNIGITSALATLVVTVMNDDKSGLPPVFATLIVVALAVATGLLLNVPLIKKPMDALMTRSLTKMGVRRAVDYDVLLNVRKGYNVAEVEMCEDHPGAGRPLGDWRPGDHGIVILGILYQDGRFEGAPGRDAVLNEGDTAMVYGSDDSVRAMRDGFPNGEVEKGAAPR